MHCVSSSFCTSNIVRRAVVLVGRGTLTVWFLEVNSELCSSRTMAELKLSKSLTPMSGHAEVAACWTNQKPSRFWGMIG